MAMNDYDDMIRKYADQYNVPFDLAKNVMQVESSGDPNAVSPTGATGLFQLTKAAATDAGIDPNNRKNPEESIKAGIKTLAGHIKAAGGDIGVALGSYNQGRTGFNKMQKSGEYAPEVVKYVNNPAFAPWVQDSKVKGIANPVNALEASQQKPKFSPALLNVDEANKAPSQAESDASAASMEAPKDIPTNQYDYQSLADNRNALQANEAEQRLQQEAANKDRQKKAYQQMGYMVLGAILGRNQNTQTQVRSGYNPQTDTYRGKLEAFGNKNFNNFQVMGKSQ